MSRKPRGLRPDEETLWKQVARTATPLTNKPLAGNPLSQTAESKKPEIVPRAQVPTFEIGSKSSTAPTKHDLSSSVSHRVAAAPLRINKRTFARMKRGKESPEGRIDLHGMTAAAAHVALTAYVLRSYAEGKRLILVITGKGRQSADAGPIPTRTGVLRHQLPDWISLPPLNQVVLQISQAHQRHGGSGAFYVYLARNR